MYRPANYRVSCSAEEGGQWKFADLHQNKDYIFGFSISVAFFSYVDCNGANTVPRRKEAPSFRKFALTALYTVLTRYYAPFVYRPPFHFARICCEGIFISNLSPPDHGRTLRLRRTRGRLELTVPPYIECSYLLASDTPTKPLATRRQARS